MDARGATKRTAGSGDSFLTLAKSFLWEFWFGIRAICDRLLLVASFFLQFLIKISLRRVDIRTQGSAPGD